MLFSGEFTFFPNRAHHFGGPKKTLVVRKFADAWRAWQESAEASAPAASAPAAESDDEDRTWISQWDFSPDSDRYRGSYFQ